MNNYIKRYKDYDKRTQEQLNFVLQNCEITDEYLNSLDLLAINYDMLFQCMDDIKENGLEKKDFRDRMVKNHALQLFQYAQNTIIKLLSSFPTSPLTKAKIDKIVASDDTNMEEILNDLMN